MVIFPLALEATVGDPAEFVVHERQECIEGILVPMFPINEQVAERLGKSLLHSRTPRPEGFCLAPIPYIGAPSKSMY